MTPMARLRPFVAATPAFQDAADTPRAFLERCIANLEAQEGEICAFAALAVEEARRQADLSTQRWREGRALSAIDGMPVGVKDVIETVDMPTGMGSPLFEGWMSGRDGASPFALREAGCVVLGKTRTAEFAATEPAETRNPLDTSRTPGGSSSGSAAAVGAGMLSAGLGTQVIGSIVRPASYCGCYGFKPTAGAINRGGSHDYNSQSAQGVLAASLADAWQVMWEIAQRAGGDPGSWPLQGPPQLPSSRTPARLAMIETAGWSVASPQAKDHLSSLLEKLRAHGVVVDDRRAASAIEDVEHAVADALPLSQAINAWEGRWPLNTYASRDSEKLSAAMRSRLAQAEQMSLDDYVANLDRRQSARDAYHRLQGTYEAVITLAAPDVAPIGIGSTGNPIFAVPGSLLGVPALSIPAFEVQGMPLNLQVLGFSRGDASTFAVGADIELVLRSLRTDL